MPRAADKINTVTSCQWKKATGFHQGSSGTNMGAAKGSPELPKHFFSTCRVGQVLVATLTPIRHGRSIFDHIFVQQVTAICKRKFRPRHNYFRHSLAVSVLMKRKCSLLGKCNTLSHSGTLNSKISLIAKSLFSSTISIFIHFPLQNCL